MMKGDFFMSLSLEQATRCLLRIVETELINRDGPEVRAGRSEETSHPFLGMALDIGIFRVAYSLISWPGFSGFCHPLSLKLRASLELVVFQISLP